MVVEADAVAVEGVVAVAAGVDHHRVPSCKGASKDLPCRRIFFLQLHITGECNLRCKHCYNGESTSDSVNILQYNELLSLIDEFNNFVKIVNARGKIYFTGGEPLLDPNLDKYISEARKLGMIPMILTNGTLVDAKRARELRLAGLEIVQVSLDGLEKTHDLIRGHGNFQRATGGLDHCHAEGIITTVMFTLNRLNMNDVEGVLEHCIEHGVQRFSMGRLVPTGSGEQLWDEMLSRDELRAFFKKLKGLKRKLGKKIEFAIHDPLWMAYIGIKNTHGCSAGRDGICVVENGDIMPCRRIDVAIGNIRETSLLEIWHSDALGKLKQRSNLQGKCKSCQLAERCGGCRAVALAVNRSELGEDPQCFLG